MKNTGLKELSYYISKGVSEDKIIKIITDPIKRITAAGYTYAKPKNSINYSKQYYNMIFYKKSKVDCLKTEINKLISGTKNLYLVSTKIKSKKPYFSPIFTR